MRKLLLTLMVLLTACSSNGEAVKPEVNSVYYEIYVGSFYDSNADGMGDLMGVVEKLDYIQNDLGATGIWLMPISPSPSYHKYDVKDYQSIDPQYGSLEDFDRLIDEMNKREMDLIIDLVLNHSSREHPWFIEAVEGKLNGSCTEKCDYYTFSNTPLAHYNKINDDLYYESEFSDTMPDLNLDNTLVRDEIEEITKFWLDRGVKGFRLDATSHFYNDNVAKNTEFLTWFNEVVISLKEDAYIVGEAWKPQSIIQSMYPSGISFFNFPLSQNSGHIVKSINSKNGLFLSQFVEKYNQTIKTHHPDAIDSIFLSNHDNGRSAGYLTTLEKQKIVASTYLLLPGNVFIYYGEEIGQTGSGRDENKRLPMMWGSDSGMTTKPNGADYAGTISANVKDQLKDKESLLNHYKKVIAVRNQYPQISRGVAKAIDLNNDSLFAMDLNGIIVVHNFSSDSVSFEGNYTIVNSALGGKQKGNQITLKAYQTVIVE